MPIPQGQHRRRSRINPVKMQLPRIDICLISPPIRRSKGQRNTAQRGQQIFLLKAIFKGRRKAAAAQLPVHRRLMPQHIIDHLSGLIPHAADHMRTGHHTVRKGRNHVLTAVGITAVFPFMKRFWQDSIEISAIGAHISEGHAKLIFRVLRREGKAESRDIVELQRFDYIKRILQHRHPPPIPTCKQFKQKTSPLI